MKISSSLNNTVLSHILLEYDHLLSLLKGQEQQKKNIETIITDTNKKIATMASELEQLATMGFDEDKAKMSKQYLNKKAK